MLNPEQEEILGRQILTVKEVANRLACTRDTVYRLISHGGLCAEKLPNGRYQILEKDLDYFFYHGTYKIRTTITLKSLTMEAAK